MSEQTSKFGDIVVNKNNTISLSRHEQVCLMRLRFERYEGQRVH